MVCYFVSLLPASLGPFHEVSRLVVELTDVLRDNGSLSPSCSLHFVHILRLGLGLWLCPEHAHCDCLPSTERKRTTPRRGFGKRGAADRSLLSELGSVLHFSRNLEHASGVEQCAAHGRDDGSFGVQNGGAGGCWTPCGAVRAGGDRAASGDRMASRVVTPSAGGPVVHTRNERRHDAAVGGHRTGKGPGGDSNRRGVGVRAIFILGRGDNVGRKSRIDAAAGERGRGAAPGAPRGARAEGGVDGRLCARGCSAGHGSGVRGLGGKGCGARGAIGVARSSGWARSTLHVRPTRTRVALNVLVEV